MSVRALLLVLLCLPPSLRSQDGGGSVRPPEDQDPAIQEAIQAFQSGWPKWDDGRKVAEIRKLAAPGRPEAAQVLAGKLKDPAAEVRVAIAEALGRLRERKTLPALAAALERERGEPQVFQAVCRALGQLDDPAAVPPLARGILSGDHRSAAFRDQANARLEAIGSIRHREAVDELIALRVRAGGAGRRGGSGGFAEFHRSIETQLRRLTGQNLRGDQEWRSWWKDNRDSFRFR